MHLDETGEKSRIAQNEIMCDCCRREIEEGKRYFIMPDDDYVDNLNICIPCKAIMTEFCSSTAVFEGFYPEDINRWLKENICADECEYGQEEYDCPAESPLRCDIIKRYYAAFDGDI